MYLVKINKRQLIKHNYSDKSKFLEPGEYIFPNFYVGVFRETLSKDPEALEISPITVANELKGDEDLNNKSLLILRAGGMGDVIFVTPFVKKLKEKYSNLSITLATDYVFTKSFEPSFDKVISFDNLTKNIFDSYDYKITLENMVENNPEAETMNIYDLHESIFKVKLDDIVHPDLAVDPSTVYFLSKRLNKANFNIVLQLSASVIKRSIPSSVLKEFIVKYSYPNTVFWIGDSIKNIDMVDTFIKLCKREKPSLRMVNFPKIGGSLLHLASLIKESDLVIGADSNYVHIAAAFNVPSVGIYGPFPSDYRIGRYDKAIGIDAISSCEYGRDIKKGDKIIAHSCFEHGDGRCQLATVTGSVFSPCLSLIKSENILEAVDIAIKLYYGGNTTKYNTLVDTLPNKFGRFSGNGWQSNR